MFVGQLCDACDLLEIDRGEALTNAGPEGRTIAIDPGTMLLGDLGTLQKAEYIEPFRRNTGIDSLLDDTRKGVPNRCHPRCKRLRDRRPGVRKRVGRNQKTGGHKRACRWQQHLSDSPHQHGIAREPADCLDAKDAAIARGQAHGTAAISAESEINQLASDGHCGAA